jgi:hypothetical protein
MAPKLFAEIPAGETVSIENSQSAELQISLLCNSGSQFAIELLPGQIMGFSADGTGAKLFLHEGDPKGLVIVSPESAY